MEPPFIALISLFFAVAVYLFLSRHIIRILLGAVILGNAVNMLIFVAGRLAREAPPIVAAGAQLPPEGAANPLPQALILTAIVISFSFFAFLLVLAYRAYEDLKTDDTDAMRVAEPAEEPLPPMGY